MSRHLKKYVAKLNPNGNETMNARQNFAFLSKSFVLYRCVPAACCRGPLPQKRFLSTAAPHLSGVFS